MTSTTNARLAGSLFLLYIAAGISNMVLFGQATKGAATTAKLASMAQHATMVRLSVVLAMLTFVIAVMLAVALYALTRDQDHDLAVMALCFRATEAFLAPVSAVSTLGLLSVATASAAAIGPDAAAGNALAASMLAQGTSTTLIAAMCFAVGSTIYSWLFLRARSIPVPLSWLGVIASVLLVVGLPLRLMEVLRGPAALAMWMPMLVFEVTLALWLLIKGVRAPASH